MLSYHICLIFCVSCDSRCEESCLVWIGVLSFHSLMFHVNLCLSCDEDWFPSVSCDSGLIMWLELVASCCVNIICHGCLMLYVSFRSCEWLLYLVLVWSQLCCKIFADNWNLPMHWTCSSKLHSSSPRHVNVSSADDRTLDESLHWSVIESFFKYFSCSLPTSKTSVESYLLYLLHVDPASRVSSVKYEEGKFETIWKQSVWRLFWHHSGNAVSETELKYCVFAHPLSFTILHVLLNSYHIINYTLAICKMTLKMYRHSRHVWKHHGAISWEKRLRYQELYLQWMDKIIYFFYFYDF